MICYLAVSVIVIVQSLDFSLKKISTFRKAKSLKYLSFAMIMICGPSYFLIDTDDSYLESIFFITKGSDEKIKKKFLNLIKVFLANSDVTCLVLLYMTCDLSFYIRAINKINREAIRKKEKAKDKELKALYKIWIEKYEKEHPDQAEFLDEYDVESNLNSNKSIEDDTESQYLDQDELLYHYSDGINKLAVGFYPKEPRFVDLIVDRNSSFAGMFNPTDLESTPVTTLIKYPKNKEDEEHFLDIK